MSLKYRCSNSIKEHHGKPIYCVAFNTYDQSNQDLVASVGGYQATVYRCHPEGKVEVLQVYVDDHTRKLTDDLQDSEQEDFYVCKWTVEAETGHPLLLLAGKLALIRVVNCHKKKAVKTLKGHGKDVNDIAVHPAHPHLVLSASKDHSIRLWNINQSCCVLLMRGPGAHIGEVFTLDFHPWDPYLFVSGAMEGAVKVWSIKEHWVGVEASQQWSVSPRRRAFPVRLVGHPVFSSRQVHNDYVDCCRWLGDLVLSKSVDYKIKLWRPMYPDNPILETSSKFVLLRVFDFTGDVMWWLRFSVDPLGQVLACGNTQGRTFVWAPGAAKATKAVELKHKNCNSVIRQTAVSMDGNIIISSTEDGCLWRWDRQQQQQPNSSAPSSSKRATPAAATSGGGAAAVSAGATAQSQDDDMAHRGEGTAAGMDKSGRNGVDFESKEAAAIEIAKAAADQQLQKQQHRKHKGNSKKLRSASAKEASKARRAAAASGGVSSGSSEDDDAAAARGAAAAAAAAAAAGNMTSHSRKQGSKSVHQDKRRRLTGPAGDPAADDAREGAAPVLGSMDRHRTAAAPARQSGGEQAAAKGQLQPLDTQRQSQQRQQQQNPQQQLQQLPGHQVQQQHGQQQQRQPAAVLPVAATVPAVQPEVITIDSSDDSE